MPLNTIGSSATGRISHIVPAAKRTPALHEIDGQETDLNYRQQLIESQRARTDYQARRASTENTFNTNYTRNMMNLNDQEKLDQTGQSDDYASRGMSHSGLRVKASSDLRTGYDKQESALDDGKAQFMAGQKSSQQEFLSQQRANDVRFRNEAINRRATQLSAGLP